MTSDPTKPEFLTRRNFGALLAATATTAAAQQTTQPAPPAPGNFRRPLAPDTPAFEGKIESAGRHVSLKAEPFPMSQVRLLPGSIYTKAQDWNRGYMERLSADRCSNARQQRDRFPNGKRRPG